MALVDNQTDIARIWEEALDSYNGVAKVDIRALLSNKKSVSSIVMEQQRQLDSFRAYRHDEGKLDKLRSFISSNADIIQDAASLVTSAASAAFPPSLAILTAFTGVITASKHVSEDYDIIESFFDVMHTFIMRLSLLENKIPAQVEFQKHLICVFSSLLSLAGLARSYCVRKGRLIKWANALVLGKDQELQDAYATLHENLNRLESAVMIQTLRTAIEIKEQATSASQGIKELQLSLNVNTALTEKTLSISVQTSSDVKHLVQLGRGAAEENQELLRRSDTIAKTLETMKKMQSKDREAKERRSAAVKPANFERLKKELGCPAELRMLERQHDLEISSVNGIFDWIESDEGFTDFADDASPFLQVTGASGMGKSTLCFKMFRILREKYLHEPTTCVVSFHFDEEHTEMKSIVNMIRWCAIKAAEKDADYCLKALVELRQSDYNLEDDTVWEKLIASKYDKKSDRRLVLILDGLGETEGQELQKLLRYFSEVKNRDLNVQIVITSDTSKVSILESLEPKRIDLVKSKVGRDIRRLARHRTRTQPRLQKLRRGLRKLILDKVTKQADSFLYVENIMRRLNSLGREGPIIKELEQLPKDIESLYETILAECAKNRNQDERELLRGLFAWLAYAKAKLTIGEANILIDILSTQMPLSIEEELDGRLSRLLSVSGSRGEQVGDGDSSEDDLDQVIDEETEGAIQRASDADNLLGFQERSLRAYFRRPSSDPDGLRSTPTQAHVTIFSMVSAILSNFSKPESQAARSLTHYAAQWIFSHLLEIGVDQVSDQQAAVVLESLFNILSNKNDALKPIEELTVGRSTIFELRTSLEVVLKALSSWSKRALSLSSNTISYEAIKFYRPLQQEPFRVFIPVSRAHINNWFSARWTNDSYFAFGCAHSSLEQGQKLPELRQNQVLLNYFQSYKKNPVISQTSFEIVSNVFWDIVKTSAAYKGIGMAMRHERMHEAAIKQLEIGLDDGSIDNVVRFGLLSSKGMALLDLSSGAEPGEKKSELLSKTSQTFESALVAYEKLAEADKERTNFKISAGMNYEGRAKVLALTGHFDLSIHDLKSCLDLNPLGLMLEITQDLISACHAAHELGRVMPVLQVLPPVTLARYFVNSEPGILVLAQEAAKRSGEGLALLGLYDSAAKYLGSLQPPEYGDCVADLSLEAARFSRSALGEDDMAKNSLKQLINDPKSHPYYVESSCNLLCEQQFEEFRLSNDPIVKSTTLEETKKLLTKLSEVWGNDFKTAKSPISLLLAGMLRKLGPALEWHDVLQAIFQSCVDGLSDDVGWNDSNSFRRLARVLMWVEGFETEAQVALTAQLYIVDPEVRKSDLTKQTVLEHGPSTCEEQQGRQHSDKPEESPEASLDDDGRGEASTAGQVTDNSLAQTTGAPEQDMSTVDGRAGTAETLGRVDTAATDEQKATTGPTAQLERTATDAASPVISGPRSEDVDSDPMSEGLLKLGTDSFYCDYCRKYVVDWAHGSSYLCLYCTDCDICEECFDKRAARHRGELEADWRVICPQDHKHIRAPVEGWRGVKDGNLRIGSDEIPFKDWLRGVEVKWKAFWDRYWMDVYA